MRKRETSDEIDREAARWAARVDRKALSAADEGALEAWLAADVRHLGAYARAQAVSVHSERARALGNGFDPGRFIKADATEPTRRRAIRIGGMAVAAAACMAVLMGNEAERGVRKFSTRLGETRIVPLEDGSVITLNTASSVIVHYTKHQRDVQLLSGEALFDVAKDPARPFTVVANETRVRAVGTSFTVHLLPGRAVKVLVREGVVELKSANVRDAQPVRVPANTRAVALLNAPIAAQAVAPTEVNRELIWRIGRIAFEGETLREAAEIFARYSDTRIVIDDSSIADETITGLFVSNDPVGFSKAVAISLNLRVDVNDGEVRLSR